MRNLCLTLSVAGLFLAQGVSAQQAVIEQPAMAIIGIECRTANTADAAPCDIPKLWDTFYREHISDQIPHRTSTDVIALYCDYEGDYTQPYTLVIGCQVDSLDVIPEGMVAKIIPAGSYAVFQAVGKHPETLVETWGRIWQQGDLKRTYTGDYEVYTDRFYSQTPQEVDVYIAIE